MGGMGGMGMDGGMGNFGDSDDVPPYDKEVCPGPITGASQACVLRKAGADARPLALAAGHSLLFAARRRTTRETWETWGRRTCRRWRTTGRRRLRARATETTARRPWSRISPK